MNAEQIVAIAKMMNDQKIPEKDRKIRVTQAQFEALKEQHGDDMGYTNDGHGRKLLGSIIEIIIPMTKEEVESWIMLKGQSGERWFEIKILDPEVGQDPTMIGLMETVSEMIFKGIQGMPFLEAEAARTKPPSPPLEIIKP